MTTTHDVPMHTAAWEIRYPSKEPGFEDVKYHGTNAVADYRDHVHPEAYARELVYRSDADARCAKLQAELDQCRQLEQSAMDGLAFAYKFNVAMGNGMRAAGCTIVDFDVKNVRAEKAEAERDALAEKVKALQDDARRYRWLRENWYYTVSDGPKDIDVGGGKTIFGCTETEVSGDEMDAAIDAASGDQC